MLIVFKEALIPIIIILIVALYYGLNCVLYKDRINQSTYYRSVNCLLLGCLILVVLLIQLSYIYHWGWLNFLSINQFANLLITMLATAFFITGLHGLIYKMKIDNKLFSSFSVQQFVYSIIVFIYLIVYWLMWKGFD